MRVRHKGGSEEFVCTETEMMVDSCLDESWAEGWAALPRVHTRDSPTGMQCSTVA